MKRLWLLLVYISFSICSFSQGFNSNGLYGARSQTMIGVGLSGGLDYYFGDVEYNEGIFKGGETQIGYFGQVCFLYAPMSYINLRLNTNCGILRGKSSVYAFSSVFLEPNFCVEYHPLSVFYTNDIYLFAGVGLNISKIDSYDFADFSLSTSAYVPVLPIGLGYQYNFDNGLQLGVELSGRLALMDRADKNLDAYPFTINGEVVRGKQSKFVDGYYGFSLKIGYKWF